MATRDAGRAVRLHSFLLRQSDTYEILDGDGEGDGDGDGGASTAAMATTAAAVAERRDAFAPLPLRWQRHGLREVRYASVLHGDTYDAMPFAAFAACLDVDTLLAAATLVDDTGAVHLATQTTTDLCVETL